MFVLLVLFCVVGLKADNWGSRIQAPSAATLPCSSSDGYYLALSNQEGGLANCQSDFYLLKFLNDGSLAFATSLDTGGDGMTITKCAVNDNGEAMFVGFTTSVGYYVKVDTVGNIVFQKTFTYIGTNENVQFFDVKYDSGEWYMIGGFWTTATRSLVLSVNDATGEAGNVAAYLDASISLFGISLTPTYIILTGTQSAGTFRLGIDRSAIPGDLGDDTPVVDVNTILDISRVHNSILDSEGNSVFAFVAGTIFSVAKANKTNLVWYREYDYSNSFYGFGMYFSVAEANDGNYVASGGYDVTTNRFPTYWGIDKENGDVLWAKRLTYDNHETALVAPSPLNDYGIIVSTQTLSKFSTQLFRYEDGGSCSTVPLVIDPPYQNPGQFGFCENSCGTNLLDASAMFTIAIASYSVSDITSSTIANILGTCIQCSGKFEDEESACGLGTCSESGCECTYQIHYNEDDCSCEENWFRDEENEYCNVTTCNYIMSNSSAACGTYGYCKDYNQCECIGEGLIDSDGQCVCDTENKYVATGDECIMLDDSQSHAASVYIIDFICCWLLLLF